MPTLLLIRHGRTASNAAGILAGRSPGVVLDDIGRSQARVLAERLAVLPLVAVVSSPLARCRQTAQQILAVPGPAGVPRPGLRIDARVQECDYGRWTGRALRELVKEPLWPAVQRDPSAVTFPGGESLRTMQHRALEAIRDGDAEVEASHGPDAVWAVVSHGDIIKSVLADAAGAHLDHFQRLEAAPCSVSVVRYTAARPFVVRTNDVGGDLAGLVPTGRSRGGRGRPGDHRRGDAAVGGGA